jgi:L-amino acid N-acyltransferase YncA
LSDPAIAIHRWEFAFIDCVHHGRRIGRALLAERTKEGRGISHRTIVVTTATDMHAGLRLQSKLGFKLVSTLPDPSHKFDLWMSITLFELAFDPGN